MQWRGVFPALTTKFNDDLSVDYGFVRQHCQWMVDNGCAGIVAIGSIGEGATLDHEEKIKILRTVVEAVGDRVPVVCGVSALATHQAVDLARDAERAGCQGLMVLPPYVYTGDWRELSCHFEAVFKATPLSCMLYNNPVAYVADVTPEQLVELADANPNLHSIKESTTDVRRVTAIRALLRDRLALFVGVDDLIVEGIAAGAVGWIAGLVNAFPRESVELFDLATRGEREKADELYRWFLPLLRLDTVPKLVQLIKLSQEEVGMGSARVRPPRMELVGQELEQALAIIRKGIAERPEMAARAV